MMTWDAVTAISTAISAVVIAATIVLGYRQIRLAGDQHVFAELETPEFRAARLFVENKLADRMRDERFRQELLLRFRHSTSACTKRF